MDHATALAKMHEWVESPNLRRHIETVEHVMRRAAPRFGGPDADADQWAIAGLLHDADYEKWPEEHPQRIMAWLRERGEEAIAHAIACHSTRWGVEPVSALDKALLACDEIDRFRRCLLLAAAGWDFDAGTAERSQEAQGQKVRRRRGPGRGGRGCPAARRRVGRACRLRDRSAARTGRGFRADGEMSRARSKRSSNTAYFVRGSSSANCSGSPFTIFTVSRMTRTTWPTSRTM